MTAKLRSKSKFAFVEFVRPGGYWPYPYSIEQAFEIFRWLVRTGQSFERPTRWGRNGPIETLSCSPSCTNFGSVDPIMSLDDLRRRFHFALLSNSHSSRGVNEWRETERIAVTQTRIVSFKHHEPFSGGAGWSCERDVQRGLEALFRDGQSQRTKESLNPSHPTARTCKSVTIAVEPDYFRFVLEYGWPDHECTSHWFFDLARTEDSEPFLVTAQRAADRLEAMTCPAREGEPVAA